jgi:hypothetical protein
LLRPPGRNDFLRGQISDAISLDATASVSTAYFTNVSGQMADNDLWSPWKPYDNLTKIDNTYMGNYNGGDHRDANGAVGMDGEWHKFHSTQSLRLGRIPCTARGLDSQEQIGILAAYTGPIYYSHPQTTAEGMPFEHRHPTQFIPDNLQLQRFLHAPREHQPTKTTNEALASPQTSATPISTSETQPSTSQAVNFESESEEDNGVHSLNYIGNHQASDSRKRSREQEQGHANQPGRAQKRLQANEYLQSSSREWNFSSMEEADAYLTSHGHSTILEIANKYLLSRGHPLFASRGQQMPL